MPFHKDYTEYNIHNPFSFVFADQAAREQTLNPYTGLAYTSDDLNKLSLQSDDDSLWRLDDITPTWVEVGSGNTYTSSNGITLSALDFQLGGTITKDTSFSPDVDGSHAINFGTGNTDRVDTFVGFY